ncbi:unnamed protein product [Urochloa decumbens]|uniref:Membrane-associated kinase regulator 6 n=1 Tax=Urochloa decumbens TaxID=240449 RepID=A0ABC8WUI9_9POAL
MEASPSRSDSFSSRGGLPRCCKARRAAPSFERLDVVHAGGLGESFNSSTASFIDMDPEEELFSMRWTSDDGGLDLFAPAACSPLLATAGLVFSDEGLLLPCDEEPSGSTAIDDAAIAYDYAASSASSPAFHTAQSTPAASVAGSSQRRHGGAAKPLLATRRLLLRYLRFLAPLCRKARALRVQPARAFSAPRPSRSLSTAAATPARRSTSSAASAAEYWCHGNADTAVRDAILHCKKSFNC